MLVVKDEELENGFANPVEGVLKLLVWANAGLEFCPNAELVLCPSAEPVCPNEGFELNSTDD